MKRYTVDDVGRIYVDEYDRWYASVSTVLDVRPKPEQLRNWLQRTDNADEINRFKRNRGTLIHYECQQPLYQRSVGDNDADMWSADEQDSKRELKEEGKWERAKEDIEWAVETYEFLQESILSMDHIIDVETYVKNTERSYAGQFDLLYYDGCDQEVVLADIKTGKSVYEKNQDQLVAYAHAVPIPVDRVEIHRMNPDHRDWEVSSNRTWSRSAEECWQAFVDSCETFQAERYDTLVEEMEDRIDEGAAMAEQEA